MSKIRSNEVSFVPVILAGGSGTRFWPRSRRSLAKQVLILEGESTMIQATLQRLLPLSPAKDVWVITNDWLKDVIGQQLSSVDPAHIICEPVPRNTGPACALAAFLLERTAPATVLGVFPSDHVVANQTRFIEVVRAGIELASHDDNIVVMGVKPNYPETGYGYIEQGSLAARDEKTLSFAPITASRVRRFREKPDAHTAENFLAAGNFAWNSGIFFWKAETLTAAVREHIPDLAGPMEQIAASYGTPEFEAVMEREYPKCENISIDYAILERRSTKGELRSNIYCLPADFGWNDLGSWSALHSHLSSADEENVTDGATTELFALQSSGNYVYVPGKTVALLGVDDLVIVEMPDALLITTKARSQDVSKVVRAVHAKGRDHLI